MRVPASLSVIFHSCIFQTHSFLCPSFLGRAFSASPFISPSYMHEMYLRIYYIAPKSWKRIWGAGAGWLDGKGRLEEMEFWVFRSRIKTDRFNKIIFPAVDLLLLAENWLNGLVPVCLRFLASISDFVFHFFILFQRFVLFVPCGRPISILKLTYMSAFERRCRII